MSIDDEIAVIRKMIEVIGCEIEDEEYIVWSTDIEEYLKNLQQNSSEV